MSLAQLTIIHVNLDGDVTNTTLLNVRYIQKCFRQTRKKGVVRNVPYYVGPITDCSCKIHCNS